MESIFCEGCDEVGGVFMAVAISGHPTTFKLSSSKLNLKKSIDFIQQNDNLPGKSFFCLEVYILYTLIYPNIVNWIQALGGKEYRYVLFPQYEIILEVWYPS